MIGTTNGNKSKQAIMSYEESQNEVKSNNKSSRH